MPSTSCPHCGTHTGTHWPGCLYGPPLQATPAPVIKERSPEEKQAYLQGYEACLKVVTGGMQNDGTRYARNIEVARQSLVLAKEVSGL